LYCLCSSRKFRAHGDIVSRIREAAPLERSTHAIDNSSINIAPRRRLLPKKKCCRLSIARVLPAFCFRFLLLLPRELGAWTRVGRAGRQVYKKPKSAVLAVAQVWLNASTFICRATVRSSFAPKQKKRITLFRHVVLE